MKILIDADGCPVVDICIKSAKRHEIECLILCDTSHIFEHEGAKTVTVSKGADSVDFKLVNLLECGDIVVTQDYGLAAMCLARGASALKKRRRSPLPRRSFISEKRQRPQRAMP